MTTTKDSLGFDQVSIGQSFDLAIGSGENPNLELLHIGARNNDVGTTVEDLWVAGGIMSWPTVAAPLMAFSDYAADADTTTAAGCRKITIEGLLSGFTAATEVLGLNGASTVTSSNNFIRINRVYTSELGTYDGTTTKLHGNISLYHGGTTTGKLMIDDSVTCSDTQVGRYTVPAGYDGYLEAVHASIQSGKSSSIYLFKRENADDIVSPFSARRLIAVYDGLSGFNNLIFHAYKLPEKTDFWISVKAGAVNTSISTMFHLFLKKRSR